MAATAKHSGPQQARRGRAKCAHRVGVPWHDYCANNGGSTTCFSWPRTHGPVSPCQLPHCLLLLSWPPLVWRGWHSPHLEKDIRSWPRSWRRSFDANVGTRELRSRCGGASCLIQFLSLRGVRWSRGSDPRLLRLTMDGLLDRHNWGATPCIKHRPRPKVRPGYFQRTIPQNYGARDGQRPSNSRSRFRRAFRSNMLSPETPCPPKWGE